MKSNLKLVLSAVGIAALIASPAMAKSHGKTHARHPSYAAPATVYFPSGTYGSVAPSSDSWVATHSGSWDATHDPRENPSN